MTFEACAKSAREQKLAGIRYEKSGRHHFRDRVTVYRDGKLLFERFCYGEAAGLVFSMKGRGEGENAVWDYDSCAVSAKTEAPKVLTAAARRRLCSTANPGRGTSRRFSRRTARTATACCAPCSENKRHDAAAWSPCGCFCGRGKTV